MRRLLLAASVAGAIDTLSFVVSRRRALLANPGRGVGSLVGLGLWSALAADAALTRRSGPRTLALAAAVGLGSAGLLAVHLRGGVRNPRIAVGSGLAAVALAAAALDARA
ncbi:MAG TPA: hypothetical protein VIA06_16660 [Candidatus Dormibacteraeota bacterium]|nr:hypothetical protein [Candidatus Dormibacteraeota bacterium]